MNPVSRKIVPRQNLIDALEGRRPEHIPFTVNGEFVNDDPAWQRLFDQGLCLIPYSGTVSEKWAASAGIARRAAPTTWQGQPAERVTLSAPPGEISQISVNGWVQEYLLKTPADYRVMTYIAQHTEVVAKPAHFEQTERRLGEQGITLIGAGRTPMQTILVDYAGVEAFAIPLAEEWPELPALAEALEDLMIRRCRLIAAGPGRYVSLLENFTAEIWGPERFARFHMPAYRKIMPIFHAGGKKVFAHFDGNLASVSALLAQTEIDAVESLTPPPEGDMTYDWARAALPDKIFWANLNIALYALPPDQLTRRVRDLASQAAPDGTKLAFEISEDLPVNWKTAIPVVLSALAS